MTTYLIFYFLTIGHVWTFANPQTCEAYIANNFQNLHATIALCLTTTAPGITI